MEGYKNCISQNLRLLRAFDYIFFGFLILFFLIGFKSLIYTIPIFYIHYLYLLPTFFILFHVYKISPEGFTLLEWEKTLLRLKGSAVITTFLSPFWAWWHNAVNSLYCLVNLALLCISASVFLFNLVGLIIVITKEKNLRGLGWWAKTTRLAIIYMMIAPVAAFFITAWFGKNSGNDIFLFLSRMERWKLLIFCSPVFMTLGLVWKLRHNMQIINPKSVFAENMSDATNS